MTPNFILARPWDITCQLCDSNYPLQQVRDIAGYNLTWSVQELLYCYKRTSLLSIGEFLKIQVLNFYEQN